MYWFSIFPSKHEYTNGHTSKSNHHMVISSNISLCFIMLVSCHLQCLTFSFDLCWTPVYINSYMLGLFIFSLYVLLASNQYACFMFTFPLALGENDVIVICFFCKWTPIGEGFNFLFSSNQMTCFYICFATISKR